MADFKRNLARYMAALNEQIEPILQDAGLSMRKAAEKIEREGKPRSTLRAYQKAFHAVLIAKGDDGAEWEGASRNAAFEAVDGERELSTGATDRYVRNNAERFGPGDEMPTLEQLIEDARGWG